MSALGRCRSNLRHSSLALRSSSLGSPPRSTILWRDYRATGMVRAEQVSCRVRMAHPLRSPAGSSTWRAGRRSLTFCQSCQGSAQKFGGRALSRHGRESRAPPAQEEWGCPEGAKPPWRLFGDFLSVQKVTGVRGEEPRAFVGDGIYSEETKTKGPEESDTANSSGQKSSHHLLWPCQVWEAAQ
jgi:hypothetical protein